MNAVYLTKQSGLELRVNKPRWTNIWK